MSERTRNHTLGGFDECAFVLSHPEIFRVAHASYPGAEEIRGRRGVQLIDGEPHKSLHAFLTEHFASSVECLRVAVVRPAAAAAMEQCAGHTDLEILDDIATPLSVRIIAAVLGLPHDDPEFLAAFAAWRDSMTPWVSTHGESVEERNAAIAAASRFRESAMPTIRSRKSAPRDDLLSGLWNIGPTIFPDWTEEDVLDQCRIMLLAGSEGVARLTATVIHLALDAPRVRAAIASRDSVVAAALVEHACRLYPPAQLRPRVAECPTSVGQLQVATGDRMCLDVVRANRDPVRFPTGGPITSRHLTFNIGARYCSGAPLARAEAEEVATAFFRAFPGCTRVDGAPAPEFVGLLFLGFSPVHVRLRQEDACR